MIDVEEQRRHLVVILLPRVEVLLDSLTRPGVDVRVVAHRLLEGTGSKKDLKGVEALRRVLTMGSNAAVVEVALREAVDLVLALQ